MQHTDSNYINVSTVISHGGVNSTPNSVLQCSSIDRDSAYYIARRLFETYDQNRSGVLEPQEAKTMIHDAYSILGKSTTVSNQDGATYLSIHDKNKDGRMTLADMEQVCIKYLCGPTSNTSILGLGSLNANRQSNPTLLI